MSALPSKRSTSCHRQLSHHADLRALDDMAVKHPFALIISSEDNMSNFTEEEETGIYVVSWERTLLELSAMTKSLLEWTKAHRPCP